ncbi:helix-turn-helix domain-containing protein [Streptomyces sp. ME02-8801-2C]|uniref:winged helix-turn-helix transcriptional regulator n=1 Tax=Streptomyces sp. ME02-8801-2C TaxID=3028680 RepID=UPI0029BA018A|nr:helix-turn-helix domain-containing protein [Streptomyces sp. ME02-8801-2C]MDX3454826.1 helix-turn-helix domain-containing protein [Streptomyces sp. ME02-8801-2C]
MESIAPHAFCPRYLHAVELIGSRWMGAVIRALLHDVERFNDLKHAIPGVSSRMLTERLRELEHEGIVERRVEEGPPTRVSYRLTPKGRALGAIVDGITLWAHAWEPEQQSEQPEQHVLTDGGATA